MKEKPQQFSEASEERIKKGIVENRDKKRARKTDRMTYKTFTNSNIANITYVLSFSSPCLCGQFMF